MPPPDEAIRVLTFLLPGFVAAAVFHALTSRPKPDTFDRVIQALVFTIIVQAATAGFSLDNDRELLLSVPTAVALALIAVYFSNNDTIHRFLRRLRITRETSYPSEWYSSFSSDSCYVVLHLKGQRRLYGWPSEWPSRPDQGHFRITEAEWLVENVKTPVTRVSAILIPVSEVEMVEFLEAREKTKE